MRAHGYNDTSRSSAQLRAGVHRPTRLMGYVHYTFGSTTKTMLAYHSADRDGIDVKLVSNPSDDSGCRIAVRVPETEQGDAEDIWLKAEITWTEKIE